MSKRNNLPQNIYSSACVQALEQEYCSSCSAAVVSSCLVSSQGFGARVMSRIYNGGRSVIYTTAIGAMLTTNMATPIYAAPVLTVSAGQTSNGLTAPGSDPFDYAQIDVYGTTQDTSVNSGGLENVLNGGQANKTLVYDCGSQFVSQGGLASGTTLDGEKAHQNIFNGGVASNTSVNNGDQGIQAGGSADLTTVGSKGGQDVWGIATNTTVQGGGAQ